MGEPPEIVTDAASEVEPSDAPEGEDQSVDIHKPKAAHSFREFLIEIGTIVCGIVIALTGEQAVEAFHWRHEVEAEGDALRQEARANLGSAAYREAEGPCIERRLAGLEEVFRRQAKGLPLGLRTHLTRPPLSIASTGTWDIAISGQALGHMPRAEKLEFSDAFDSYKAFNQLRNEEDAVWRRLGLINHSDLLSSSDWVALHQTFGEAEELNSRMKSLTGSVLGSGAMRLQPAKVEESSADRAEMNAFCAPLVE